MAVLHLGVLDVPYKKGGKSTGEVAEILEAKYHVIEIFYEEHQRDIAGLLEEIYGSALDDLLKGAPAGGNTAAELGSGIKSLFAKFIDGRQMDGLGYPGIPTQAALRGVNHSKLHPYAKGNPERPSFRDTGQYLDSFWAEIEG
jgi:hypothetical protein